VLPGIIITRSNALLFIYFVYCEGTWIFVTYATFTLNGFDDQERNLTFVKTGFQVLILKFHACCLSILFLNYISRDLYNPKILLYKLLFWYLVVKPACVNAA